MIGPEEGLHHSERSRRSYFKPVDSAPTASAPGEWPESPLRPLSKHPPG
jgi:hypothetical protein